MGIRTVRVSLSAAFIVTGLVALVVMAGVRGGALVPVGGVVIGSDGGLTINEPAGKLVVATDPGGRFSVTLYDTLGNPVPGYTASRTLENRDGCVLDVGSPDIASLIKIRIDTPSGVHPNVGLVDNGMGSSYQNNCKRSNGRLEDAPDTAHEKFVVQLGSKLSQYTIDYVSLDIEGKHGAKLVYSTSLDDTPVVTDEEDLPEGTDNTADNGGTDNDQVTIGLANDTSDDFDTFSFGPESTDVRGDISWEGGGDYADGTHRSVIYLTRHQSYEYGLVCYDADATPNTSDDGNQYNVGTSGITSYEVIAEGDTNGDGKLDDSDWTFTTADLQNVGFPKRAQLFRYTAIDHDPNDGIDKPDCATPIGVNLNAADGSDADTRPEFVLDPSTEQASLRLELTWVVPLSSVQAFEAGTADDPFARRIDTGDGPMPAVYCNEFAGDAWDFTNAGLVDHPADTPWCYLTDERTQGQVDVFDANGAYVDTIDVVFQRMVWDGQGDPLFF